MKWSRSVVSDSQQPHGLQPTRLLHPWDFPGESIGVGCHCLLRSTVLINPKSSPPALPSLLAQCDKPESSQCFIETHWLWVLSSQPESINYTCTSVSCSYSVIEPTPWSRWRKVTSPLRVFHPALPQFGFEDLDFYCFLYYDSLVISESHFTSLDVFLFLEHEKKSEQICYQGPLQYFQKMRG